MLALLVLSFIFFANPLESNGGLRKPAGCDFFGKENAVRILGGDLTHSGNDWTDRDGDRWKCVISKVDNETGPKIYFLMSRTFAEETAAKDFDMIRRSNNSHKGFEEWPGVGDEAIVHAAERTFSSSWSGKACELFG